MSTSSNSTIITPPTAPISAAEAAAMMPTAKGGEVRTPDKDYFEALQTEVNDKGFLVASTEDVFQWARKASFFKLKTHFSPSIISICDAVFFLFFFFLFFLSH